MPSSDLRRRTMNKLMASDVIFVVGLEKKRIAGYKQVLALSNEMFMKQFYGMDIKKDPDQEIHLANFDSEAFNDFLNYLYFDKIQLRQENVLNIFNLAKIYMDQRLLTHCSTFISSMLNYCNAFTVLKFNEDHGNPEIQTAAEEYLKINGLACFQKNRDFKLCNKEMVMKIMQWELLNCPEEVLWENVVEWGKASCVRANKIDDEVNLRLELAEILPLARLALLPFTQKVHHIPIHPRENTHTKVKEILELIA